MRPIYLIKDHNSFQRKIMLDMAWLASHKQIRLFKTYFEDGLYIPYRVNNDQKIDKYYLTRDKIIREDEHHYFFDFPFSADQVEQVFN